MAHEREEVQAAIERYIAVRDEINAGRHGWSALAQFFTDDAVFIDPAWGRVQGIDEMKRTVFGEAMDGLEDWQFPTEFYAIAGDNVIVKWQQILPGQRADGTRYVQSGYSTLIYSGQGKFCYEEDLLEHDAFLRRHAREWLDSPAEHGHAAPAPEPRLLASRPAGSTRCVTKYKTPSTTSRSHACIRRTPTP